MNDQNFTIKGNLKTFYWGLRIAIITKYLTRESTETFDKNNLNQLLLMTHAYRGGGRGNLKNIYVYNNRHSGGYSVPLYQRKQIKMKRKKRKINETKYTRGQCYMLYT